MPPLKRDLLQPQKLIEGQVINTFQFANIWNAASLCRRVRAHLHADNRQAKAFGERDNGHVTKADGLCAVSAVLRNHFTVSRARSSQTQAGRFFVYLSRANRSLDGRDRAGPAPAAPAGPQRRGGRP